MSKAEEKAREEARQQSNQRNRTQADHWQNIANQKQADRAKLQKKIERLKSAQTKLHGQISTFKSFESNVKNTGTKISTSQFKGTLRDKFDKELTSISQTVKTEENHHQSNLAKLDGKIAQLEAQEGDIVGAIESALSAVSNFLAAIF